jgi:MFS family permease
VLLLASFFSITYIIGAALFGFVAGTEKDRNSRTYIAWTIALSAVIFAAISLMEQSDTFILLFGAFGFVFGILEVETRTYVSSIVKERILGGAFGTWRTVTGLSMIASGILLGILWDVSSAHMFTAASAIAFVSFLYFILNK